MQEPAGVHEAAESARFVAGQLRDVAGSAQFLGLRPSAFRQWRARGLIPGPDHQVGRKMYWVVETLIQARKNLPKPTPRPLPPKCADGRAAYWEAVKNGLALHPRTISRLKREATERTKLKAEAEGRRITVFAAVSKRQVR